MPIHTPSSAISSVSPRGRGRSPPPTIRRREHDRIVIPCRLTALSRVARGRVQPKPHPHKDEFQDGMRAGFAAKLARIYRDYPYGACLGYIYNPFFGRSVLYIKDHITGVVRPKMMKDDMWNLMSESGLEAHRRNWLRAHPWAVEDEPVADQTHNHAAAVAAIVAAVMGNNPPANQAQEPENNDDSHVTPGDQSNAQNNAQSNHNDLNGSGDQNNADNQDNNDDNDNSDEDAAEDDVDEDIDEEDIDEEDIDEDNIDEDDDAEDVYEDDAEDDIDEDVEGEDDADDDEEDSGYDSNLSPQSTSSDESDTRRDLAAYNPIWVWRIVKTPDKNVVVDPHIFDLVYPERSPLNERQQRVKALKEEIRRRTREKIDAVKKAQKDEEDKKKQKKR
ncbi:hypothetical protein F4805DRAFT_294162 [Annulohypoxylon moriforme]|nr:hypothetical protein F4805DRAFT_294162 [Annulohypoxylon moriforme]